MADEEGQSTLEYLLVLLGIIAVLTVLYAFVRAGQDGVFGRLAVRAASHVLGGRSVADALFDIFMF